MKKNLYIAGIDETATDTQKVRGWCYFCLSQIEYHKFCVEAQAILDSSNGLSTFHGSEYKSTFKAEYEAFLLLIKKYAQKSDIALISCKLFDNNLYAIKTDSERRITESVLQSTGISNKDFIKICKDIAPELFSFMQLLENQWNDKFLTVEIDSDDIKKNFSNYSETIKGKPFNTNWIMTTLYNQCRALKHPASLQLKSDGIKALDDQNSFAIQAADVIGNFSTACIYFKPGNNSTDRAEKGQLFYEIFKDETGTVDFSNAVKLSGQNDLEFINGYAALPLKIC
jgi:hypothetical protein